MTNFTELWEKLPSFNTRTLKLVRTLHNSGMSSTAEILLIRWLFKHSAILANTWTKFTLGSGLTVGHFQSILKSAMYKKGVYRLEYLPACKTILNLIQRSGLEVYLRQAGSCHSLPIKEGGFRSLHFARLYMGIG